MTNQTNSLSDFYKKLKKPIPEIIDIDSNQMPEPHRRLLVHGNDMTSTLEAFHSDSIHLKVLDKVLNDNAYSRCVVLALDKCGTPVEFGAITIYLDYFPKAARDLILEGYRPLGAILADEHMPYKSCPSRYFQTQRDEVMVSALALPETNHVLYGRCNVIENNDGDILADIIEILP